MLARTPSRTMPLDALVGAVAPNLNVEIATRVQEGTRPVARPGDWLEISDFDLLRRLNPAFVRAEDDTPKADRALMQPVENANGQVFGRAFISASAVLVLGRRRMGNYLRIASRSPAKCARHIAWRGGDRRSRYC